MVAVAGESGCALQVSAAMLCKPFLKRIEVDEDPPADASKPLMSALKISQRRLPLVKRWGYSTQSWWTDLSRFRRGWRMVLPSLLDAETVKSRSTLM